MTMYCHFSSSLKDRDICDKDVIVRQSLLISLRFFVSLQEDHIVTSVVWWEYTNFIQPKKFSIGLFTLPV